MNKSTSKSHFYIVYARSPKGVLDLIKFPDLGERKSVDASDFASIIPKIHEQVKKRLQQRNDMHKKKEDLKSISKVFEEGEMVMEHLRKKIFPRGTYSKMNYEKVGPCKILRKITENAYKL